MVLGSIDYQHIMRAGRTPRRGVFISYRRDDASGHAGRLYDLLAESLGAERVFIDVDTVGPGSDYRRAIEQALDTTAVFLALVGPRWVGPKNDGTRRIDDEADTVRRELEAPSHAGYP